MRLGGPTFEMGLQECASLLIQLEGRGKLAARRGALYGTNSIGHWVSPFGRVRP